MKNRKAVIKELLGRRVAKVLPTSLSLKKLLKSGKKLRIYQGFDPTGAKLHLGHAVGLQKLMEFARAGHEVIFLFGTGTVLVGDPSLRTKTRKQITQQEINDNIRTWKKQVEPIVDFSKVKIKQNGHWLTKLTLKEIIKIASQISAIQLFKRQSFTRRIKQGQTVWYHETMYPLLQGYDSVVMDVDLEIGGTDQEFNMLIGRELQRKINQREKFVLTTPMILGTDGKPMSKTSGNCIWLSDSPQDMFGKLMSISDSQILPYLELVSNMPANQVNKIKLLLVNKKIHPMEAKKQLALTITAQFHGFKKAKQAQKEFETVVQKKKLPKNIPSFLINKLPSNQLSIPLLLTLTKLASSKTEAKRLINQGCVYLNQKPTQRYQKN